VRYSAHYDKRLVLEKYPHIDRVAQHGHVVPWPRACTLPFAGAFSASAKAMALQTWSSQAAESFIIKKYVRQRFGVRCLYAQKTI
jgi:hypothetical protein